MSIKTAKIAIIIALSLLSQNPASNADCCKPDAVRCTACRDCTKCAWCTSGKGSCSVCRDQTAEEARRREAIKERARTRK